MGEIVQSWPEKVAKASSASPPQPTPISNCQMTIEDAIGNLLHSVSSTLTGMSCLDNGS